jgi:hypothetical protein
MVWSGDPAVYNSGNVVRISGQGLVLAPKLNPK